MCHLTHKGDQWWRFSPLRVWSLRHLHHLFPLLLSVWIYWSRTGQIMTPRQSSLQRNTSRHCWFFTINCIKVPRRSTSPHLLYWFLVSKTKIQTPQLECVFKEANRIKEYIQLINQKQSEVTKLGVAVELPQQAVSIRVLRPVQSETAQHTVSCLCCWCWWEALVHLLHCSLELLESQAGSLLVHRVMSRRR